MTNKALAELGEFLKTSLPNEVECWEIAYDELMVWTTHTALIKLMTFLRDDSNCLFKMLVDITAADYPERDSRFEVIYNMLSLNLNQRVRVKLVTGDGKPVPSVVPLFSTANWFEREVWDMYGILFADHPDLRRLLTDYGFEGHPLRKDFPLTGYYEVRYDNEQKRVVYEPVNLPQEFRNFDFLSPWEGTQYVLPGDEKAGNNAEAKG